MSNKNNAEATGNILDKISAKATELFSAPEINKTNSQSFGSSFNEISSHPCEQNFSGKVLTSM